jgi:hypothetical protein
MANEDIKKEIRHSGVLFWKVALKFGCADTTFSRKLRKELPEQDKNEIRSIIKELRKEG